MDRASIIAIEEVCKRCHLYTNHCGMSEYPSQCVDSGHFIDGYRKAEKDLALTWEDIPHLIELTGHTVRWFSDQGMADVSFKELYEEVLRRFNEKKEENK